MKSNNIYNDSKVWLTIDIEEITDTNFNINWKKKANIDYDLLINRWIEFTEELNMKSTCFILGSFAKKFPKLVEKLSSNGHEIASHGNNHSLVYEISIDAWEKSIKDSKAILEDLSGTSVSGYRSASWSLPFEKKYYDILAINGYKYSSSYFPMKTYMYGNSIDKKQPFIVSTQYGDILEYPIIKSLIPYSGGLYLRTLPLILEKFIFKNSIEKNLKPILYIHPYELIDSNLVNYFRKYADINIDFLLAFYSTSKPLSKIQKIIVSL